MAALLAAFLLFLKVFKLFHRFFVSNLLNINAQLLDCLFANPHQLSVCLWVPINQSAFTLRQFAITSGHQI